jgi:hypothetical protein
LFGGPEGLEQTLKHRAVFAHVGGEAGPLFGLSQKFGSGVGGLEANAFSMAGGKALTELGQGALDAFNFTQAILVFKLMDTLV